MSNFNHHNVLTLIGIVYAEGNMPIVILPFMHRGDIRALVHSEDEVLYLLLFLIMVYYYYCVIYSLYFYLYVVRSTLPPSSITIV